MKARISDKWLEEGSGYVIVTDMKLNVSNYPVYCDKCHGHITLQRPGVRISWTDGRFFKKLHAVCAEFDQEVLL